MKAAVTTTTGAPEVIQVQDVPMPAVKPGWVLIEVKAFGLNRSELYTRQGHSPGVTFPRIQGIECVGEIAEDPSGTYQPGQKVMAMMGGMGRQFDGGYASFALLPLSIVFPFTSTLPWSVLGAIPEMFQTVNGSLRDGLEINAGEILLIRGGTSSIGMLACQLAKHEGLTVVATTRNRDKVQSLKDNGADHVLIDNGTIDNAVLQLFPEGVDKTLELVGTVTLKDSLRATRPKGIVCMTGILGNEWTMKDFTPMGDIPMLRRLTVYMGSEVNVSKADLQAFIDAVAANVIKLNIDKVFQLEDIAAAHAYMESNQATGKVVVTISAEKDPS